MLNADGRRQTFAANEDIFRDFGLIAVSEQTLRPLCFSF